MQSKWDNIFVCQPGSRGGRQLENDITKNLLKTLKDADSRGLRQLLGLAFEGFPCERDQSSTTAVIIDTQKRIDNRDFSDHDTYLLGLSRYGEDVADKGVPAAEHSTIDGLIEFETPDGPVTVGIEVKTGGHCLNPNQMAKYKADLGITNPNRTAGLCWSHVFGLFNELARDRSLAELDRYLYREFAAYLEYEQLNLVVAEHRGRHRKQLRLKRQRFDSQTNNWEAGELLARLQWDGPDEGSTIGWLSTTVFEDLFAQLPASLREATFAAEKVSYHSFIHHLYDWQPEIQNQRDDNIASVAFPDGYYRLRMKWIRDDDTNEIVSDVPHLRLVHYYPSGRYDYVRPPNLDPDAFENLFNDIPHRVREEAFCGEPDFNRLWEYYLGRSMPQSTERVS